MLWEILFFISLLMVGYTYFGYPALLIMLTRGRKANGTEPSNNSEPSVSLIIAAYNEESVIERKIENSLALAYPHEKLEIIVVSDGSSDRTVDIASRYSDQGIVVVDTEKHIGKTHAQNEAVLHASGDIFVFSDANSMYMPDAVSKLVAVFGDQQTGCVCGELRYTDGDGTVGRNEGLYWRYEQFCKKRESMLGSLLGVNGAIYAIRREAFIPLDRDLISDFMLPVKVYGSGWLVRYTDKAVATEEPSNSYSGEFSRKLRIITRSLHSLFRNKHYLNPFKYGFFAIELWSHKLIRWFVPFSLLVLFASSIALYGQPMFRGILYLQAIFYCLALLGVFIGRLLPNVWVLTIPYYFVTINTASLLAIFAFFRGKRYDTWSTERQ